MTIQRQDVTLKESQRLSDEDDGGGRRTANEVISGEVNNLMPDISRLDRTIGRVNLRKAFLHIDTATRDRYFGAHTIVDKPPKDPRVSLLLFSTGSHTDERLSAQRRIESYVSQGPEGPFRLIGDQLEGQRSINIYQRKSERIPEIGDVLVLSIEAGSQEGTKQFVRVTDLEKEIRTFTDTVNNNFVDFEARAVSLRLSTELRNDFPGKPPNRFFEPGDTKLRTTNVADAAEYFGIAEVTEPVAQGDTQISLDGIFSQIVPNTKNEIAQTDVDASPTVSLEKTSGNEQITVEDAAHTDDIPVEINNRARTWTNNHRPLPAPGTLRIEFRSIGNWQIVEDRGDGKLVGDGSGSVDFATGSSEVTLAALPDVGTSIIYTWGTPTHYSDRSDTSATIEAPIVDLVPEADVSPGSLTINWEDANSNPLSASDDGAGSISGDATGRVVYSGEDRIIRLQPNSVPPAATTFQLSYDEMTLVLDSASMSSVVSSGSVSFTLGTTPVNPGSVSVKVPMLRKKNSGKGPARGVDTRQVFVNVTDDANGNLVLPDGTQIGTVDYTNGDINFDSRRTYTREVWEQTGIY